MSGKGEISWETFIEATQKQIELNHLSADLHQADVQKVIASFAANRAANGKNSQKLAALLGNQPS